MCIHFSLLTIIISFSRRINSMEMKQSNHHGTGGGYQGPVTPLVPHPPRNTPNSGPHSLVEYPSLSSRSINTLAFESPVETISYAQAVEPRLTKRTINDRTCLSPIDYLPKRSALSKIPTDIGPNTHLSPTIAINNEDVMEIGVTPNNDRYDELTNCF